MVASHLEAQLLDLDTHHHRFRLSFVRVPHRSGNTDLAVAVYQEQLERGNYRSGVRFGSTSLLVH